MTPEDNSDASINVWCDWLTDNGQEQLANEIRFEEQVYFHTFGRWLHDTPNDCSYIGDYMYRVGAPVEITGYTDDEDENRIGGTINDQLVGSIMDQVGGIYPYFYDS